MIPVVTPVFASLLALLFIYLSIRVISVRRSERIGIGDKGNALLLRRMRVQNNFVEYAPIALLLMLTLELMGGPAWLVTGFGILLLTGRCLHAYGVSQEPEPLKFRAAGMLLTFTVIVSAALANLALALYSAFAA